LKIKDFIQPDPSRQSPFLFLNLQCVINKIEGLMFDQKSTHFFLKVLMPLLVFVTKTHATERVSSFSFNDCIALRSGDAGVSYPLPIHYEMLSENLFLAVLDFTNGERQGMVSGHLMRSETELRMDPRGTKFVVLWEMQLPPGTATPQQMLQAHRTEVEAGIGTTLETLPEEVRTFLGYHLLNEYTDPDRVRLIRPLLVEITDRDVLAVNPRCQTPGAQCGPYFGRSEVSRLLLEGRHRLGQPNTHQSGIPFSSDTEGRLNQILLSASSTSRPVSQASQTPRRRTRPNSRRSSSDSRRSLPPQDITSCLTQRLPDADNHWPEDPIAP
jgi:hypothetical protein